jgi:hypothetical protein
MSEPTAVAKVDHERQMLVEREARALEIHRGVGMTPEQYKRDRMALLRFVNDQLEEAEYGARGKIVKVNDYYCLPGSKKKALSRRGADSTAEFFGIKILNMEEVRATLEKDYVSITERCTVHRSDIIRGVREATCNSAEVKFQQPGNKKNYGAKVDFPQNGPPIIKEEVPDWRAAENDIRARAQKRAYVQAVIHAVCGADILEVADDMDFDNIPEAEYEDITDQKDLPDPRPVSNGGPTPEQLMRLGSLIAKSCFTDDERNELKDWLNTSDATKEAVDDQIVRIEDRVETWRAEKKGPIG